MAALAASLMCCGVSKSGSPAAKPIIGRPSALYFAALAVIARVGDSLMDKTRSDRTAGAELLKVTSLGNKLKFF
jgi:hypothetical protein